MILEAFLWGLGTAIGELPPYFVARAASLAGRKHEELEEMIDESKLNSSSDKSQSLSSKLKLSLYQILKQHAFLAVLLCASIPNPLFDLAGLTCGHFLVPFGVFFGATFIGTAIVTVSIQSVFVILSFSEHYVEGGLKVLERVAPSLQEGIRNAI